MSSLSEKGIPNFNRMVKTCCDYMEDKNSSLLSIILDLNVDSWILREKYNQEMPVVFTECLEAMIAFINTFLLQNHHNQIVVSIYGNGKPDLLFPKQTGSIASNLVSHSQQTNIIQNHLTKVIINRMTEPSKDTNCTLDACFSRNLCFLNKYAQEGIKKRILIINVTENPINSYMNFMNSVFHFKSECPVDVCQIYSEPDSFMKQASMLTKGSYVRAKSSKSMYALLCYYFLPNVPTRKTFLFQNEKIEPMEVRCSCHGKKISNEMGYVCSVCLAILCKYSEKCPLHETDLSVC